jgi:hypothetical protein
VENERYNGLNDKIDIEKKNSKGSKSRGDQRLVYDAFKG